MKEWIFAILFFAIILISLPFIFTKYIGNFECTSYSTGMITSMPIYNNVWWIMIPISNAVTKEDIICDDYRFIKSE